MGESLHQDLLGAGGLRAVLENVCPDSDIEMYPAPGLFDGFGAQVRRGDRAVRLQPLRDEQRCSITFSWRDSSLRRVCRTDLAEIAGSAATWLGGATPAEFALRWPFADFVAIAEAFERGDRIEQAWQSHRVHDRSRHGRFVEAAMREPLLRRMFPFTSMFWMSFRPTADEYTVPGPWVRPAGNGRFTVEEDRREEPTVDYDAETAVRVVLKEMDRLGIPGPDEVNPAHVRPAYGHPKHRRDLSAGDRSAVCHLDRRALGYPVTFRWRNETMAHAWTHDPVETIAAAEQWVGGASPRKLARAWPFVDFVDLGEAFERGDRHEYEWQKARARAMYGLRPVVEAAMREPRLRRLEPVVSANRLWFRTSGERARLTVVSVGGRCAVLDEHGVVIGDYDAEAAVRVCAAEMDRLDEPGPDELRSP